MSHNKRAAIVIVSLFALFSTAIGDDAVYKSGYYTLTNPRITAGGSSSGKSEHYTITNIQIGNIAGGKAKSEHYTIEAFPVKINRPPNPPTVNPVTTPTNNPIQTLSGAKDKNTSICINGYEVIPINTDTIWNIASYNVGEEDGPKTLSITSKNKYNLESPSVIVNITLDTIAPAVTITSPINGAIINEAPITVTGAIDEPCDVLINGALAVVTGNTFTPLEMTRPSDGYPPNGGLSLTGFTAEDIDLRKGENIITATAYDLAGNYAADTITVTSTVTSDYNITKITQDTYEYDPTAITAGSQVLLTVKLEIDGLPAPNEPIEFRITQGNGSIAQPIVNTNTNGEATVTFITDTSAFVTNLVEVFDRNFSDKKIIFHIDAKEGIPASLFKLTDETIHPAPGVNIELIAKLIDINSNPIQGEEVTFEIISGGGCLSLANRDIHLTQPTTTGSM